jgi:hypothetical protein
MKLHLIAAALLASSAHFRPFSDIVETVFIKGDDGNPLRINASEYDEKKHGKTLDPDNLPKAGEAPAPAEPDPLPNAAAALPHTPPAPVGGVVPTTPAPDAETFVSKKGKKWVIADKDGNTIPGTEEYDSEAAATEAFDKLKATNDAATGSTTTPPPAARFVSPARLD